MNLNIAALRADTPGCAEVLHLNNAGASLMPRPVLDAQIHHLEREGSIGGYEASDEAAERISDVYSSVARLLNARPDEIALMENATAAWCAAFYAFNFAPGDRILTTESEFASNYIAYLQLARRKGIEFAVVPSDESGEISLSALESMIDERTKLISINYVPSNGGLVNPAAGVGRIARAAGIPFLLDACQAAGQIDLDVEQLGCDLLSATGRKYLRGPRGSGFLYVRRSLLERLDPPFLDLHSARLVAPDRYEMRSDARRFENWEFNYAALLGLGAAVDYALSLGLPAIEARVTALAVQLRSALAEIPGVTLCDLGIRKCGIVTFRKAGLDPREIQRRLRKESRINIDHSTALSALIDMRRRGLDFITRASVHYFNDEAEVIRFAEAVDAL